MKLCFNTANYVAREGKYSYSGDVTKWWGEAESLTRKNMDESRIKEIAKDISSLGFKYVDVWEAHLDFSLGEKEYEKRAEIFNSNGLKIAAIAGGYDFTGREEKIEELISFLISLGSPVLGGGGIEPHKRVAPIIREKGLKVGFENHQHTVDSILEWIGDDNDVLGATVDTGWFATYDIDPAEAIRKLGSSVFHVHLKDIEKPGEHRTCAFGKGCVDIKACIEALSEIGYQGALSIENEPGDRDPNPEVKESRDLVLGFADELGIGID